MVYIDVKQTGLRLKKSIRAAGYDVKTIQNYLHLSCPQPIYRWFKGKLLPSVDHLLLLSNLLGVHMEDLLVVKSLQKPAPLSARERFRQRRCSVYQQLLE